MGKIDYSAEIEKMMWGNNVFANAPSLYSLGIENKDCPIVFQCRNITIRVTHIRRNCRVYLSIEKNGNSISGDWAMHNDLPPSVIKELYKIVKTINKKVDK